MLCKTPQQIGVLKKLLQHLRRHFNKVSFRRNPTLPSPALSPSQHLMHQVPEFVEARHHIRVLHQPSIVALGLREIAHQRSFGQTLTQHTADNPAL